MSAKNTYEIELPINIVFRVEMVEVLIVVQGFLLERHLVQVWLRPSLRID